MHKLGEHSPDTEAEDVFFSRNVSKIAELPVEIAKPLRLKPHTTYIAIGSHACWKFLPVVI